MNIIKNIERQNEGNKSDLKFLRRNEKGSIGLYI